MNEEVKPPADKPQMDKKWIAIGVALGVVYGAAMDDMSVGLPIGIAFGFFMANRKRLFHKK